MLFILHCLDRPGSQALRASSRVPHLEFVARHAGRFRFGGRCSATMAARWAA